MTTADEVTVVLDAQIQGYQRKLRQAQTSFASFAGNMKTQAATFGSSVAASFGSSFAKGVAGFFAAQGITGLVNFAAQTVKQTADLGDFADRLGISAELLQRFQKQASLAGIEQEEFNQSIEFFVRIAGKSGFKGDIVQAYFQVADAINAATTAQEKANLAAQFFGRGGTKMVQAFAGGARVVNEQMAKFNVLSDDMVKNAQRIDDEFNILKGTILTWVQADILSQIPNLEAFINSLKGIIDMADEFKRRAAAEGGLLGITPAGTTEDATTAARHLKQRFDFVVGPSAPATTATGTAGGLPFKPPGAGAGTPPTVDITTPRTRLEGLTDAWDRLTESTQQYTDTAASAFAAVVTGADDMQSALSGLLKTFANMAAQSAFKALFAAGTNALLGGGKFAGMLASGGTIPHGQWGIVGEHGPELVAAGIGGARVKPLAGGSYDGGGGIVLNSTVNAPGASGDDLKRVLDVRDRALLAQLPQAIARHHRNRRMQ